MADEQRIGRRVLALARGDVTTIAADAIVNAANSALAGGVAALAWIRIRQRRVAATILLLSAVAILRGGMEIRRPGLLLGPEGIRQLATDPLVSGALPGLTPSRLPPKTLLSPASPAVLHFVICSLVERHAGSGTSDASGRGRVGGSVRWR